MNRKNIRSLTLTEATIAFPAWFNEIFATTISILKSNPYVDFERIKSFIKASIEYIPPKKTELKHIKVDVFNKGIKDEFQYVSIDVYAMPNNDEKKFLKFTKSLKVRLRNQSMAYD